MTRTLSAIVLILFALGIVFLATPPVYLAGIGLMGTVCLYEYGKMMGSMGLRVRAWFLYGVFWILLLGLSTGRGPVIAILAMTVLVAFVSSLWRTRCPVRDRVGAMMAELFGILYMALCLYPALPIRYDFGGDTGLHWTLLMLLTLWGGDTFALAVGKKIGTRPLAPVLSPKKTREGAVAGLLAGAAIALAAHRFLFPDLPLVHVIAVSVLLGVFGQLGDLAESMIKRAAGIKDSSHLIPGHGGVLDRIDSLLFSLPVLYAYLLLVYR